LDPLGTAATNRLIVPVPGDYDDGEVGGMIGRGNRSTRRKPALVPLCPPQTPHALPGREPGPPRDYEVYFLQGYDAVLVTSFYFVSILFFILSFNVSFFISIP
jgi:hypothetical protein